MTTPSGCTPPLGDATGADDALVAALAVAGKAFASAGLGVAPAVAGAAPVVSVAAHTSFAGAFAAGAFAVGAFAVADGQSPGWGVQAEQGAPA